MASQGSADWNLIEGWLRNMAILKDSLGGVENMAFLLNPSENAHSSTISAAGVWNTPTPSIHYDPLPPSEVGPLGMDTDRVDKFIDRDKRPMRICRPTN